MAENIVIKEQLDNIFLCPDTG